MSQSEISSFLEVGVDYITATSHQRNPADSLYSFGRWMVSEEASNGCKSGDWRASGYRGFRAGRACVGIGRQGCIVRASGESASEYWNQLYHVADNITRLDLQVTTHNGRVAPDRIRKHHAETKRAACGRGRPAAFKCFYGPNGAETLVLGSRASDRYCRIYDKGLESGEQRYRDAVRYELELKRDAALNMAGYLDSQENDQALMVAEVHKFLCNRGTHSGFYNCNCRRFVDCVHELRQSSALSVTGRQRAPELTRVLKWLRVCVSPSVTRLRGAGLDSEVCAALGWE